MGNSASSTFHKKIDITIDRNEIEEGSANEKGDASKLHNAVNKSVISTYIQRFFHSSNTTRLDSTYKKTSSPHSNMLERQDDSRQFQIIAPEPTEKAIVLSSYVSLNPDYLSLEKGESVRVISREQNNLMVKSLKTRKKGLVDPTFLVSLNQSYLAEKWYFHHMSRDEADKCLRRANFIGYFIVRPSQSSTLEFSLSILKQNYIVKNYAIKNEPLLSNPFLTQYYIQKDRGFATLNQLISYYSQNPEFFKVLSFQPLPIKFTYDFSVDLTYTEDLCEVIKELGGEKVTLSIGRQIGSGNFGQVHKAYIDNGKTVAVKLLKSETRELKLSFIHEAHMLEKLHHPKILSIGGYCVKKGYQSMMLTEYMENGNLLEMLKSSNGRLFQHFHLTYISYQICLAGVYLEEAQVIHRDIAARNILVGESYRNVKIADFGLSYFCPAKSNLTPLGVETNTTCFSESDTFNASNKVPLRWTAPEAINYNKFSTKSDVWSFGILLFEIFTYGAVPYKEMTTDEVVKAINSGYQLRRPVNCPENIYEVMRSCWARQPYDRPTFKDLIDRFELLFSSYNN